MSRSIALVAALAGLFASTVGAAPVTLRANATVVAYTNDLGLLPFTGSAGDSFYVDYTFESTILDSAPSASLGTYEIALLSYTAVLNSVAFTPGVSSIGNFIQVVNDSGPSTSRRDEYNVASGAIVAGQATYSLQLLLTSALGTSPRQPFSSTALPLAPFDVTAFVNRTLDVAVFTMVGGQLRSNALQGAVTSITAPAVVPAPAALWLLASGVGALVLRARGGDTRRK
jgi:hypothetical protein